MSGALLNPGGQAAAITETEHQALQSHLAILRSTGCGVDALTSIINAALATFKLAALPDGPIPDAKSALAAVVWHVMADNHFDDEYPGVLIQSRGNPVEPLDATEMKTLWDTLKTLRRGGWFPDWLALQVHFTGNSDEPDCRFPSPLKIMGTLVEAIDQYEANAESVHEMVAMRPDVFAPKPAAPIRVVKSTPEAKSRPHRKRRKAA